MKGKTGKPSALRGGGMARKGIGMALKGGGMARKGTGSRATPGGKVAKMAMGGMSGGRGPAAVTSANINKPSSVATGGMREGSGTAGITSANINKPSSAATGRPAAMPVRGSGTNGGGPNPKRNIGGIKGPIRSPGSITAMPSGAMTRPAPIGSKTPVTNLRSGGKAKGK